MSQRDGANAETLVAEELYTSTYWATVRQLADQARQRGYQVSLWVASAGYGLVAAHSPIKPYSATFASGAEDSVCAKGTAGANRLEYLRAWWAGLTAGHGLASLEDVERASVMVVAGPAYVEAMQADLVRLADCLGHRERLVIFSGAAAAVDGLSESVVPTEARFVHKVGGAMPALHARVAQHLLEQAGGQHLDARILRAAAAAVLAAQPAWEPPSREKGTDRQVTAFIRALAKKQLRLTYTMALREYRRQGKACEQKRFKELFQLATGVSHGA
jgi:hypothetical protein